MMGRRHCPHVDPCAIYSDHMRPATRTTPKFTASAVAAPVAVTGEVVLVLLALAFPVAEDVEVELLVVLFEPEEIWFQSAQVMIVLFA